MNFNEFSIGTEFKCGSRTWMCTDVGTRTIVAVCTSPMSRLNDWFRSIPEDHMLDLNHVDTVWLKDCITRGDRPVLEEHVLGKDLLCGCESL